MKLTSVRCISYGVAFIVVPAAAIALYLTLGSPDIPDHPLEERRNSQTETLSQVQVESLVAGRARTTQIEPISKEFLFLISQLEQRIDQSGGDTRGSELLGGAHARTNNYKDAWRAFEQAALRSNEPRHKILQLENMFAAADGYMSADSITLLNDVKDFDNFRIPYYKGVVQAQKGNLKEAAQMWADLLKRTDVPAPLAQTLSQQIQQANQEIGLNTPSDAALHTAAQMTDKERSVMIDGMVSGLAQKLEDTPNDLPGWLQLIQAYAVLGRTEDAGVALTEARKVFSDQPEALARLTIIDAQINQ